MIKGINKEIEFAASAKWNDAFAGIEAKMYTNMARKILKSFPYDMFVFETSPKSEDSPVHKMTVRTAGYNFFTDELNEKMVVARFESLETPKFWLKVDDYGDRYVATFLFPEDY